MQRPIGEVIRQARRQQNITQTELGDDHFSKSYVSAVERNKIIPSVEALHFFAEQLGQSSNYFSSLIEESDGSKSSSTVTTLQLADSYEYNNGNEALTLLDILLDTTELHTTSAYHELPVLPSELLTALPPEKQSRYYFLAGLIAREKQNRPVALHAFESALVLAPPNQQPPILKELGLYYYEAQSYSSYCTALEYFLRALKLLHHEPDVPGRAKLEFQIELYCGDCYRAPGLYQQALEHYERARQLLNPAHDIQTAGLLYRGLGYCTYACIYQKTAIATPDEMCASTEEMEREFQRAVSYLLQSRSVYQVCGDQIDEAKVHLTCSSVLLDFSIRRKLVVDRAKKNASIQALVQCASLLDTVEEQCRQVLLDWQNPPNTAPRAEVNAILFVAPGYLIQVFVQRAILAQINSEYPDTAYRERARASYLCQQVLDAFSVNALPLDVAQIALDVSSNTFAFRPPSLPRLPDASVVFGAGFHDLVSLAEIYFSAAMVAEMLGRSATVPEYARECYAQANEAFQSSLVLSRQVTEAGLIDRGYLTRQYQRCASVLEGRIQLLSPAEAEETNNILLTILKDGIWHIQHVQEVASGVEYMVGASPTTTIHE